MGGGPQLPVPTYEATMITVGGVNYHIGGNLANKKTSTDILRLDKENSSTWKFSKAGNLKVGKMSLGVTVIKTLPKYCNSKK